MLAREDSPALEGNQHGAVGAPMPLGGLVLVTFPLGSSIAVRSGSLLRVKSDISWQPRGIARGEQHLSGMDTVFCALLFQN